MVALGETILDQTAAKRGPQHGRCDRCARCVEKESAGTTDYLWLGWQTMEERNPFGGSGSTDTPIRQYVWGQYIDECVQLTTLAVLGPQSLPAGAYYLLQDLLYRGVALTNSSGAVVEAYDNDAYGNTLVFTAPDSTGDWWSDSAVQSSYGANEIIYCGYRYDPESELYYVRNRTYNPVLGRWLQRDPIGYRAGPNVYLYAAGWPTRRVDPSGKFSLPNPSTLNLLTELSPGAGGRWPSAYQPPPQQWAWEGGSGTAGASGPYVRWRENPYLGLGPQTPVSATPSGTDWGALPGGEGAGSGGPRHPKACCGSTFWCLFDIVSLVPEIIIINHRLALAIVGTAGPDEVAPEISIPAQLFIIAGAAWRGYELVGEMKCDCKTPGASASAAAAAKNATSQFKEAAGRAKEAWHAIKAFGETVPEP